MTTAVAPAASILRSVLADATAGGAGLTVRITSSTLYLRGDLDLDGLATLRAGVARLAATASTEVTVDIAEVAFLDAIGAGLLSEVAAELTQTGQRLVVIRPQPQAMRVFGLAHAIRPLGFAVFG